MNDYEMILMETLKGLTEDMPEAFFHLAEIIHCQALELYPGTSGCEILIPYMMNDAIEYYLVITATSLEGGFNPDETVTEASLEPECGGYKLKIRQSGLSWCEIGFSSLEERASCYQYHEIAHFWVKGDEMWRRLVYMIGTINDKYDYFGDRFCSYEEMQIMDLIGFGPFRYFSPVDHSLDERYEESEAGYLLMTALAREAGDEAFLRLLKLYAKHKGNSMMTEYMAMQMRQPERRPLYDLILQKVAKGSEKYPERHYSPEAEQRISYLRSHVKENLALAGYTGEWPYYHKGDSHAIVTEEHPFTVMESRNFHFRIRIIFYEQDRFTDCRIMDSEGGNPFDMHWEEC